MPIQGIADEPRSTDNSELRQPPICSAATANQFEPRGVCAVRPRTDVPKGNEIKVSLTAEAASVHVGGYTVITEGYNGSYLTPVIEAMPGDTVAAHLENQLQHRDHANPTHDGNENPTNLHFFHGGIVSPNNARPTPAEAGTGDNVYVLLRRGPNANGKPSSFDFSVPIPGPGELDARVLEKEGTLEHPSGLNWYHSHLHGISSDQVMGGMSGLLSVGAATANVRAGCVPNPGNAAPCLNDVDKDTDELRSATDVHYALLRDLTLKNISQRPDVAKDATADWAPDAVDFPPQTFCGAWDPSKSALRPDPILRNGFCQRDEHSAWLFTLNGQRFPTITVEGGRNLLLRLANVSSNVGYWLEVRDDNPQAQQPTVPLWILNVDGVVPASPVAADQPSKPILAKSFNDILLMPASRAEIYIRNDSAMESRERVYILKSKTVNSGFDEWPEIRLARIVLRPVAAPRPVPLALNILRTAAARASPFALVPPAAQGQAPPGCVRDLNAASREYRRVTFLPTGNVTPSDGPIFAIKTEIVGPEKGQGLTDEDQLKFASDTTPVQHPFEDYMTHDGLVNWDMEHVCIKLDHESSHKQLWVLKNLTGTLHNFHIHQMKFRLARIDELEMHGIKPNGVSHTCAAPEACGGGPDFGLYDERRVSAGDQEPEITWHDTIPVPDGLTVFIIMSYDANQQIGRFVFHCHILKHEDVGLMAPIEVWSPQMAASSR